MADRLVVRGAREHNLQDVSLDLPRDRLIVFTGLSGSGKSSLAFDTIYAEGQRRYVESLSAYARQFLGQMDKPDVDFIEGLSPAISIDQKSASRNPRSTVGTVTEVYDYLRLLYARIGKPHCPNCGRPVARQSPQQIVDRILAMDEGTRFMVLAPVVRGRKGEYGALLDDLAKQGFARARVDGVTVELADRGRARPGPLRAAHHRGGGRPPDPPGRHPPAADRVAGDRAVAWPKGWPRWWWWTPTAPRRRPSPSASIWPAPTAGSASRTPHPGTSPSTRPTAPARPAPASAPASRSTPSWWCPIPPSPWPRGPWSRGRAPAASTSPDGGGRGRPGWLLDRHPWEELRKAGPETAALRGRDQAGPSQVPQPVRTPAVLPHHLRGHRPVAAAPPHRGRVGVPAGQPRGLPAGGALPGVRRGPAPTPVAGRHRRGLLDLRPVLPVHLQGGRGGGRPRPLRPRPPDRRPGLPRGPRADAVPARRRARLPDPGPVGGHPVRGRGAADPTGQPDRQRPGRACSTCSTSRPSGSTNGTTNASSARSNDCATWATRSSSSSTTRRPSASPTTWSTSARGRGSTAAASSTRVRSPVPAGWSPMPTRSPASTSPGPGPYRCPALRRPGSGDLLTVEGAREHNLHDIDAEFPLGRLIAVTGVSGSGKSTLVNDILLRSLAKQVHRAKTLPGLHRTITGVEQVDKVVEVDQAPIGRTPRSNPATYTGVFDHIRRLFSQTQEAKVRGYQPGPVLLQREGRPVRGVLGGRHHPHRDALPARHLRALRGVPGGPLQPRHPGGHLPGQDHRRRARALVRGGTRVLRPPAAHRPAPPDPGRRGPRLHPAGPAGTHPVRR